MATQFAINEPDSFSSANQTYTPVENFVLTGVGLQSFEIILIPDDVLFGFGAIDLSGTTTTSTFLCLPTEVARSCRGPFSDP